jgi:hypothetical protein
MSEKKNKKAGIPNIDRAKTESVMIFAAIHFAKMEDPLLNISETVARVVKAFGLRMTAKAAERRYYFIENAFLNREEE